jgi:sigma-B regulation protein RsbU (phosphoserine phosphatase)
LLFGDWDDRRGVLRYANCGHPPALVVRAGGGVETLETTAPVLGVLEAWNAEVAEVPLRPGDRLAIASDGVMECPGEGGGELGAAGLAALLERHRDVPVEDLAQHIVDELAARAGLGLADDATLLCAQAE